MTTKRRGRGEGSVFQRPDGLYVGTLHVGYSPSGKRLRQTVYASTKREVLEKLASRRSGVAAGVREPGKGTVGDYLESWLQNVVRPNARANTLRCYRNIVDTHVIPVLGGVALRSVNTGHFELLLGQMERAGKSPRMRQLVLVVMRTAFKAAVETHKILKSPLDGLRAPTVTPRRLEPWTQEQVAKFLEAASPTRHSPLFAMALGTGARFGELLGLQWSELDLAAGEASISKTLIEGSGVVQGRADVKTAAGRRLVKLPAFVVTALRGHRARLLREGLAASEWVFPSEAGTPLIQRNVTRVFEEVMAKAGLPRIRFHDLRHTSATLMITNGVDVKTVSERLGHANVQITLQTYAHRTQESDSLAAQTLERMLTGGRKGE